MDLVQETIDFRAVYLTLTVVASPSLTCIPTCQCPSFSQWDTWLWAMQNEIRGKQNNLGFFVLFCFVLNSNQQLPSCTSTEKFAKYV